MSSADAAACGRCCSHKIFEVHPRWANFPWAANLAANGPLAADVSAGRSQTASYPPGGVDRAEDAKQGTAGVQLGPVVVLGRARVEAHKPIGGREGQEGGRSRIQEIPTLILTSVVMGANCERVIVDNLTGPRAFSGPPSVKTARRNSPPPVGRSLQGNFRKPGARPAAEAAATEISEKVSVPMASRFG